MLNLQSKRWNYFVCLMNSSCDLTAGFFTRDERVTTVREPNHETLNLSDTRNAGFGSVCLLELIWNFLMLLFLN